MQRGGKGRGRERKGREEMIYFDRNEQYIPIIYNGILCILHHRKWCGDFCTYWRLMVVIKGDSGNVTRRRIIKKWRGGEGVYIYTYIYIWA